MRPTKVVTLLILLMRYFVGGTVYEDDLVNLTIEPIHHLNLRTLILNKTQAIHQPRLLINTARFYTTDDPASATPMVKYQPMVNSPQIQSKANDEQQPAFQNANLFPYALQMPSAVDEQQQPSNVVQKVYESSAPIPSLTGKPNNDADQQFTHKKFRHIKNSTKQVHTFTNQNRLITINNRNVHRYLKNFNVGTQYHTKVKTIAHNQVNEMIINRHQTVLEPRLLVNLMSTGSPPPSVRRRQNENKTLPNSNRSDAQIPTVELSPAESDKQMEQANNENETVNIERRLDTRLPDVYLPVLVEEIHNDQPPRPSSSSAANFKTEAAVSDDTFKTIIRTNDAVQMPSQSGATHQGFLLGSWDNFTPSAVSAGIVSNNPYSQSLTREIRVSPDDQFVAGAFESNVAPHHSISSDNMPKAGGTMQSLQNKFLMRQQTFAANFPVTQSKLLSGAHTGFLLGRWDNFRPS